MHQRWADRHRDATAKFSQRLSWLYDVGMSVAPIRSTVPARMDRLPWSTFHWRMIIALGITWILDGVEIGLACAFGDVLRERATLHLDAETVALSGTLYLIGEVIGALYFGHQADRLGRRKLFIVTLALYL